MNLLLTLQPYSLEQAFWRCKRTRRALMLADVCAYTTALLHMNMSVLRMAATQPSKSIFSIHLGSEHWLFNLGFISTIYQTSALLLLLAIALSTWTAAAAAAAAGRRREPFYTRHRHTLCLMSRLLRLFYCMAHLLQPGAMSFFAHAIAARTRDVQQRPMKALLVNVLHPTAFWMAQANFVLPWRWMLLIQLVNSAAVLALWSRPLPCLLQAVQLKPFNASELFYQAQATDACKALQYASSYIRMWIGDVTYMVNDKRMCEGLGAVQALQAFATVVCLAVLPLAAAYAFERRYKLQFLRSMAQADAAAAAAATTGGSTAAAGSDAATRSSNSSGSDSYITGLSDEPVAAVVLRWLACVVAMLLCAWLLAEVLVTEAFGSTACPA